MIEIEVEDEPLFVNQVDQVEIEGKTYLQLTTTTQDIIIVDSEHPIFMRQYQDELRPYVHVRFESMRCFSGLLFTSGGDGRAW